LCCSRRPFALDPNQPLNQLYHSSWNAKNGLNGSVAYAGAGEFQLKDGVWKFVKIIDEHPDWTAIYALTDPAQRVWLVYTDRLVVIDGANKRTYSTPGRLTIGALNLVAARDEHLWVGRQSGLAFLKDDRFHTLHTNAAELGSVTGLVVRNDGVLHESEPRQLRLSRGRCQQRWRLE
jgi:hypothetical protein